MPLIDDERALLHLHELWRARLSEARSHYEAEKTSADRQKYRAEYLRVLRLFTSMVMRGEYPEETLAKALATTQ
jgi:hypothetical protein